MTKATTFPESTHRSRRLGAADAWRSTCRSLAGGGSGGGVPVQSQCRARRRVGILGRPRSGAGGGDAREPVPRQAGARSVRPECLRETARVVAREIERTARIGRLTVRTVPGCHRGVSRANGRNRSLRELVVARHSIHRFDRFGLQPPISELALPTLKELLDPVANSPHPLERRPCRPGAVPTRHRPHRGEGTRTRYRALTDPARP
jgi:hypothetical protein